MHLGISPGNKTAGKETVSCHLRGIKWYKNDQTQHNLNKLSSHLVYIMWIFDCVLLRRCKIIPGSYIDYALS